MPILFFVNCERTVLFSVKRDLDPPLYHPGAVKCKGFLLSKSKCSARACRKGTLGISVLRFWQFFRSVFRLLCQKTSVFWFWCSFRLGDFSFFSIRFSVFVENNSGFSVLLSNVNM